MELGITAALQVAIIFILIAVGFVMTKMSQISEGGVRDMTNILLNVVTPCVLIEAYQKAFDPALAMGLLRCAAFALITQVFGIILSSVIFRDKENPQNPINIFCSVYSNCGFMAIPLLDALLGSEGVFYGSTYLAVFTVLYWTHGVALYSGSRKNLSLKKAIINPGVVGTFASLLLFVLNIRLPFVLSTAVGYMADLNTPLAMVILGTFLAKIDFKKALFKKTLYGVSALRLIVIPICAVFIARLMGLGALEAQAVVIPAVCPAATVSTLFAARYRLDAGYSSELVALTTVFSVITIPLVMAVASAVLG